MFRSPLLLRQNTALFLQKQSLVGSRYYSYYHASTQLLCFQDKSIMTVVVNSSKNAGKRHAFGGIWSSTQKQHRFYSPMTKEEEEAEKERVSKLSDFKKEQELRKLNREIMKLNMLKGINTGELYTFRGRYKMLLSDYGLPMMAWYAAVWFGTGVLVYSALTIGGMDAISVLQQVDHYTGWNFSARVDPELGKLGIVVVLNEMLEPIRLPLVVFTVKPVVDRFFPPKV